MARSRATGRGPDELDRFSRPRETHGAAVVPHAVTLKNTGPLNDGPDGNCAFFPPPGNKGSAEATVIGCTDPAIFLVI